DPLVAPTVTDSLPPSSKTCNRPPTKALETVMRSPLPGTLVKGIRGDCAGKKNGAAAYGGGLIRRLFVTISPPRVNDPTACWPIRTGQLSPKKSITLPAIPVCVIWGVGRSLPEKKS